MESHILVKRITFPQICKGCLPDVLHLLCIHRFAWSAIIVISSGFDFHESDFAEGAQTRKACTVGCIGCMKCQKVCKFEAVTVENNLATIDYDKCKNCGLCQKECPTGAILSFRKKKAPVKKPDATAAPAAESANA